MCVIFWCVSFYDMMESCVLSFLFIDKVLVWEVFEEGGGFGEV